MLRAGLSGVFTILGSLLFGTDALAQPRWGEEYQTIDGASKIKIHSATELEFSKDTANPTFLFKYSIENNKLRMVMPLLGSPVVLYFDIKDGVLIAEGGRSWYSAIKIDEARKQSYCAAVSSDLRRIISYQNGVSTYYTGRLDDKPFFLTLTANVTAEVSGVTDGPGRYFVALVSHPQCATALVHRSTSTAIGITNPLPLSEATATFNAWRAEAEKETAAIRQARTEAAEAQAKEDLAERQKVEARKQEARKVTRTVATTLSYDVDPKPNTITLTDASLRGFWGGDEVFFDEIREISIHRDYQIHISAVRAGAGFSKQIYFKNKSPELRKFLQMATKAWEEWKVKFPDQVAWKN